MRASGSENLLGPQLRYVGHNVPYFRALHCDDGRQIEDFPLTFKPQIRNNYASFISDHFRNVRQELVDFLSKKPRHTRPDGAFVEEFSFDGNIVVGDTTGTSGTVLRCPKTMADRFRLGIGIWRQRRSVDPLANPGKLFRFIHTGLSPRYYDPWNYQLSNLKAIYAEIRKGGYRWLHCPGYVLERHVEVFQCERWRPELPNLKFIEFAGHFVRKETATALCRFFNASPVDQYGMLETWTVATACSHGMFHINDHNVHVEIIDEEDRPVEFSKIGRIVVTSLQQRLLPFVRYVTDDYGMFIEKTCECGLGRRTLTLIEGRSGNLINGAPGRVFGDVFFMDALKRIGFFDLLCIRVRQVSPDDFIVQTNSIGPPHKLLLAHLKKETEALLARQVRFQHIVFTEAEMRIQERLKPWVFRWEGQDPKKEAYGS